MKKALLLTAVMFMVASTVVQADGTVTEKEVCTTQYGGGTKCRTEKVTEEVTHKTVDAGIGDYPMLAIALGMAVAGASLYGVASYTKNL